MILNDNNNEAAKEYLKKVIDLCVDFKLQKQINLSHLEPENMLGFFEGLPLEGLDLEDVLDEFVETIMVYCTNFGSPRFMGFPDSGNAVAAMAGAVFGELLQQNLINQSFCGPSATFAEISIIRWLREVVGYNNSAESNVWNIGGIITPGGTSSNSIAMLLARENHINRTMQNGVTEPHRYKIVIPEGIGHYSIKSSQMWLGCGNNLIEIPTIDYKMDINALKETLLLYKGEVMAVVIYAGDSRSMAIDRLSEIYDAVKEIDPHIWLHVDACHGFSLGFSEKLKHKISGIEKYDSISTDPHKVLLCPYVISSLLIKDPEKMKLIASYSDLIMQEEYAFGQITPFIGSKNWSSLKLWFLIKNLGKQGLGELIERRVELAEYLYQRLESDKQFVLLNRPEINSVMFLFKGSQALNAEAINLINRRIHSRMLQEGKFHLHQFSITDERGIIQKSSILYPLRYMGGNPNTSKVEIEELIDYLIKLGQEIEEELQCTV